MSSAPLGNGSRSSTSPPAAKARPEPRTLAERLFQWEVEGEWDTFSGAVERYADVLGDSGVACYRELAEAACAGEPELAAGSSRAWGSRRFRIAQILLRARK